MMIITKTSLNLLILLECSIWSLRIPSMHGEFIGMSLYFFVIDFVKSINQLGEHVHPSIEELKTFGRSFCSMKWKYVP